MICAYGGHYLRIKWKKYAPIVTLRKRYYPIENVSLKKSSLKRKIEDTKAD